MAGKRVSLGSLAGTPAPPEMRRPQIADQPAREVSVDEVALNPLNPRTVDPRSPAVEKIRKSIAEVGQIQASTVVTRRAFLAIHGEHEETIGSAPYVLVAGEQRRAAVEQLARPLKIAVDDELAANRSRFLAATLAENLDRSNLNAVEEARGVQSLVTECGTGKAAAEQLGRTAAWVVQRLNLLKLIPEVQAALIDENDETRLPLRAVRDWHVLDSAGQLDALTGWRKQFEEHGPEPAAEPDAERSERGPRPRINRHAAAIRRLGETPHQIAATLRDEMPKDELAALVDELVALTRTD
jgi:ParB family transcriptional regulator, chromosome partitioning protein